MEVQWSQSQRDRLKSAARHARPPYIRVKARAILNVAEGGRIIRVARTFRVSRQTLSTRFHNCTNERLRANIVEEKLASSRSFPVSVGRAPEPAPSLAEGARR